MNWLQKFGVIKITQATELIIELANYQTELINTCGPGIIKTFLYQRLELGKAVAAFKVEFYKSVFNLNKII